MKRIRIDRLGSRLLALMLFASSLSCSKDVDPPKSNVLLITIDTLRADHLGAYESSFGATPFIDSLAAQSVVFSKAIAAAPITAPSLASILTGLYRPSHGVLNNTAALVQEVQTLPEELQEYGYQTIGIVANPAVIMGDSGFEQGFDIYKMPESTKKSGVSRYSGESFSDEVQAVLDGNDDGRPIFLWVHFMDPHGPYRAPDEYVDEFSSQEFDHGRERVLGKCDSNYGLNVIPKYQHKGLQGNRTVADYHRRYLGEIRFVDAHVKSLVGSLEARGFLNDDSLLALSADHGESLGEDDYYFQHGWTLGDGSLRVPLLLKSSRFSTPRRIDNSVSLVDLAPTILDYLGLSNLSEADGESLLPLLQDPEDRPAFSQTSYGNRLVSLQVGDWKYVFTPAPPADKDRRHEDGWFSIWPKDSKEELYNVAEDVLGSVNKVRVETEIAGDLRDRVAEWLEDQDDVAGDRSRRHRKDVGLYQVLESLGYVK